MFRAFPLPIIRSFPLYIRYWYMSCRFDDSFQARPECSILLVLKSCHKTYMTYQDRMYSGKLLVMGRGTARNMLEFFDKINLENLLKRKLIWLLHLHMS